MFRRRKPLKIHHRLLDWVSPQNGWARRWRYFVTRVLRLKGSAHAIASGAAVGIAISFTPFYGTHLILAYIACVFLRGNYLAAFITLQAGNPLTFPPIIALNYKVGAWMLGETHALHTKELAKLILDSAKEFFTTFEVNTPGFWEAFWTVALGGIPFVILSWGITYILVYPAVKKFQEFRHKRAQERHYKRLETLKSRIGIHHQP